MEEVLLCVMNKEQAKSQLPKAPSKSQSSGDGKKKKQGELGKYTVSLGTIVVNTPATTKKCLPCYDDHLLESCSKFKALQPTERIAKGFEWRVHFRCLHHHKKDDCFLSADEQKSTVSSNCKYSHHQLLHGAKAVFKKQDVEGKEENKNTGAARNVSVTVPVATLIASTTPTGMLLRFVKLWVRACHHEG